MQRRDRLKLAGAGVAVAIASIVVAILSFAPDTNDGSASGNAGGAGTPRDEHAIDVEFVSEYCAAQRDLYQHRTSDWKESVRARTPMSAAAEQEVVQAWRQYETRLRGMVPPSDLSRWRDAAVASLSRLLVGTPSGLELERKYHPPPLPETARRLEPLADALGCAMPFVLS